VIGVLSGPADPAALATLIPTLIWTNARVQGLSVGSSDSFADMCRMLSLHTIKPVIDQTFHWTEARAALEAMQAQGHFGKIVLTF
jgi:NADPH:quinone reductase-like Zn-dependent oxidoreductase